jgi:hypothetical protein
VLEFGCGQPAYTARHQMIAETQAIIRIHAAEQPRSHLWAPAVRAPASGDQYCLPAPAVLYRLPTIYEAGGPDGSMRTSFAWPAGHYPGYPG